MRYGAGTDRAECQKRSEAATLNFRITPKAVCARLLLGNLRVPNFTSWRSGLRESRPLNKQAGLASWVSSGWVSGGKLADRISYCNRVKTLVHSFKRMTFDHANRVQVAHIHFCNGGTSLRFQGFMDGRDRRCVADTEVTHSSAEAGGFSVNSSLPAALFATEGSVRA